MKLYTIGSGGAAAPPSTPSGSGPGRGAPPPPTLPPHKVTWRQYYAPTFPSRPGAPPWLPAPMPAPYPAVPAAWQAPWAPSTPVHVTRCLIETASPPHARHVLDVLLISVCDLAVPGGRPRLAGDAIARQLALLQPPQPDPPLCGSAADTVVTQSLGTCTFDAAEQHALHCFHNIVMARLGQAQAQLGPDGVLMAPMAAALAGAPAVPAPATNARDAVDHAMLAAVLAWDHAQGTLCYRHWRARYDVYARHRDRGTEQRRALRGFVDNRAGSAAAAETAAWTPVSPPPPALASASAGAVGAAAAHDVIDLISDEDEDDEEDDPALAPANSDGEALATKAESPIHLSDDDDGFVLPPQYDGTDTVIDLISDDDDDDDHDDVDHDAIVDIDVIDGGRGNGNGFDDGAHGPAHGRLTGPRPAAEVDPDAVEVVAVRPPASAPTPIPAASASVAAASLVVIDDDADAGTALETVLPPFPPPPQPPGRPWPARFRGLPPPLARWRRPRDRPMTRYTPPPVPESLYRHGQYVPWVILALQQATMAAAAPSRDARAALRERCRQELLKPFDQQHHPFLHRRFVGQLALRLAQTLHVYSETADAFEGWMTDRRDAIGKHLYWVEAIGRLHLATGDMEATVAFANQLTRDCVPIRPWRAACRRVLDGYMADAQGPARCSPAWERRVEGKIAYTFRKKAYLHHAMTHASAAPKRFLSYERLEFLGDAVLDYAIGRFLFETYPQGASLELMKVRQEMVTNRFLAVVAIRLNLQDDLLTRQARFSAVVSAYSREYDRRVNATRPGNGRAYFWKGIPDGPKALADVVEALIGAHFLDVDADLEQSAAFVRQLIIVPWIRCFRLSLFRPTTPFGASHPNPAGAGAGAGPDGLVAAPSAPGKRKQSASLPLSPSPAKPAKRTKRERRAAAAAAAAASASASASASAAASASASASAKNSHAASWVGVDAATETMPLTPALLAAWDRLLQLAQAARESASSSAAASSSSSSASASASAAATSVQTTKRTGKRSRKSKMAIPPSWPKAVREQVAKAEAEAAAEAPAKAATQGEADDEDSVEKPAPTTDGPRRRPLRAAAAAALALMPSEPVSSSPSPPTRPASPPPVAPGSSRLAPIVLLRDVAPLFPASVQADPVGHLTRMFPQGASFSFSRRPDVPGTQCLFRLDGALMGTGHGANKSIAQQLCAYDALRMYFCPEQPSQFRPRRLSS
ncbi:hypothetical protein CXG81DRAFT_23157 [Caulochytrium protostelioides]|uniref:RNase III domain-containing protein n=1 Tax=Caulochytrium protostelioides TaxID=1555241 RepID=A0A4P9XF48_9FUNG|nr:hypothetical protein CXG81DRAFT_23157 [Caulochytrium protostelioides]|eukprot:RKP04203.1 hypothetical protein CXG81DRAFT_23157 [Caulochytrium protostelioides]